MFFNKKQKSKLDPKVRFQNRQFNQKLNQARNFKRVARPVSESNLDRFLESIGLGSRIIQGLLAILILAALYLIYAPNFLTLQSITIEGASEADAKIIEASIRDSLGSAPFVNPQSNLVFLSQRRVQEATVKVPAVWEIVSVKKNYSTNNLHVSVVSKYEKFLVRTAERVYDVYNDGTLKGEAGVNRDDWVSVENPNMIKVDIEARLSSSDNIEFFGENAIQYFTELQHNISGVVGSKMIYLSLPNQEIQVQDDAASTQTVTLDSEIQTSEQNINADDTKPQEASEPSSVKKDVSLTELPEIKLPIVPGQLDIVMQKGSDAKRTFRVIVDTKETAHDVVQRLNMLLSQTLPERYNALSYIDLRVRSRAYVCLLGTVCNR